MNEKKYVITSLSYVTVVNILSLIVSAVLTILVPRFVGVQDYGIWQLFIFYQGYLGIFHLGWNDGIYLRYGGKKYRELEKKQFCFQYWMLIFLEMFFSVTVYFIACTRSEMKGFFAFQLSINLILINSRYMLIYLLQATGRIKEYASIILVERLLYFIIIIFSLCSGGTYIHLIWSETFSKLFSYLLAVFYCKDIVFNKFSYAREFYNEIILNISVGIKLLFSNLASILIIGICRFGIERNWGVDVFGEISLTITLSQLFISFITNVGTVLFPLLKRMDNNSLIKTYEKIKLVLGVIIFFALIWFYPAKQILLSWIPNYSRSIYFMSILLPICFYESNMALLNNPYLKALRKERNIMGINLTVMCFSFILTGIFSFILKSLTWTVFSITILLSFRCIYSEKVVATCLNLKNRALINRDNLMVVIFVISNFVIQSSAGFLIYLLAYSVYVISRFKRLKDMFQNIKISKEC